MSGNQVNNIILRDLETGTLRVIKNEDTLQIGSSIQLTGPSTLKLSGLQVNKILVLDSDGYVTTSDLIVANNLPQLSGDVTGSHNSTVVTSISGDSPVNIVSSVLQWDSGSLFPSLNQAGTSSLQAQDLSIAAQDSMHIDGYGGNLKIISGIGNHSDGYLSFITGHAESLRVVNSQANSFSFGVGGVSGNLPTITSGSGEPSTLVNNGSLYLRVDGSSNTGLYTYQDNNWHLISGSSQQNSSSYRQSFTSSDLIDNILSIEHNLNNKYVNVSIYDNDDYMIFPSRIKAFSESVTKIDLSNFDIVGTWNIVIIA